MGLLTAFSGLSKGFQALAILGAILGLLGSVWGAVTVYNNGVREAALTKVALQQEKAVAAADKAANARAISALEAKAAKAEADKGRLASIMEAINAAPKSRTCVDTPVVRSYLSRLRNGSPGGNAGPTGKASSQSVGVP